jgi:hypothetical protein
VKTPVFLSEGFVFGINRVTSPHPFYTVPGKNFNIASQDVEKKLKIKNAEAI